MKKNIQFQWLLFGASLVSLISILLSYLLDKSFPNSPIFIATFLLFATTIISDRIATIIDAVFNQQDETDKEAQCTKKIDKVCSELKEIPKILHGDRSLTIFDSRTEGLTYAINAVKTAVSVKNTVLRYGNSHTAAMGDQTFKKWIDAKRESMNSTNCIWTEIVSKYIGIEDQQTQLITDFAHDNPNYIVKWLDDVQLPMVQIAIFQYAGNKKDLLFGWELPGLPHGPCFLSTNQRVIDYFEAYFSLCLGRSIDSRDVKM